MCSFCLNSLYVRVVNIIRIFTHKRVSWHKYSYWLTDGRSACPTRPFWLIVVMRKKLVCFWYLGKKKNQSCILWAMNKQYKCKRRVSEILKLAYILCLRVSGYQCTSYRLPSKSFQKRRRDGIWFDAACVNIIDYFFSVLFASFIRQFLLFCFRSFYYY